MDCRLIEKSRQFITGSFFLIMLDHFLLIKNVIYSSYENLRFKRLSDIIGNTHLETAALCTYIFVCSKEYNGNLFKIHLFLKLTELLQSFKTVHPRHLNIEQHNIRCIHLYIVKQCLSGLKCRHALVVLTQDMSRHFKVSRIIIYNYDPISHCLFSPRSYIYVPPKKTPTLQNYTLKWEKVPQKSIIVL